MSAAAAATRAAVPRVGDCLRDRVILVTGATGGLGRAASIACARAGARVVLLGRRVPQLNRVYDAIVDDPDGPLPPPSNYPMDLAGASPDDHAQLAGRIAAEFGRLDGLLHCAAEFAGLTPMEHTDPGAFARMIHVNLTARWWLTQACLPLLKASADASVVFAIDEPSRATGAYWGGYGLAQPAMQALVGMLQAELGDSPVRISGLRPGPMRTDLRGQAWITEHDRDAVDPQRYAAACVSLLSAEGAAHRGKVWAPSP